MRLVLAATESLNAAACDRLIARLADERSTNAPDIVIDLQAATYIDPFGAACLSLIARQVVARGQRLTCILPGQTRAQRAAVQTGLIRALRPLADLRNLPADGHAQARSSSLPLTTIRSRADVQGLLAYLVSLAQTRLGFDTGDVLDATKVVSELSYNVIDHSGAEGIVVAQLGQDRHGTRFVALAVVDSGLGIRASLARRYPEAAAWPHAEAIQRALGGLSSRPSGGGAGLRSVDAVVRRYAGRLVIRSDSDRLSISADQRPRTLSGASFPGTQVGISFSQRV
jgi:anti-sigma regulatory factor (Ser/Thr protein kinase)/anti-anti-sigma regulatory factor